VDCWDVGNVQKVVAEFNEKIPPITLIQQATIGLQLEGTSEPMSNETMHHFQLECSNYFGTQLNVTNNVTLENMHCEILSQEVVMAHDSDIRRRLQTDNSGVDPVLEVMVQVSADVITSSSSPDATISPAEVFTASTLKETLNETSINLVQSLFVSDSFFATVTDIKVANTDTTASTGPTMMSPTTAAPGLSPTIATGEDTVPVPMPTAVPTILKTTSPTKGSKSWAVIESIVGADKLNDRTSPFYKALDWINYGDVMQLTPDNDANFVQRYFAAYFYYATSVKRPWYSCAPTVGNETADCIYKQLVSIDPIAYREMPWRRWLSEFPECTWAGVYCDEAGQFRSLEFSK